jgi:hypothetical protein
MSSLWQRFFLDSSLNVPKDSEPTVESTESQ